MPPSSCIACGFPLSDPNRISGRPLACPQCGKMVIEPLHPEHSIFKPMILRLVFVVIVAFVVYAIVAWSLNKRNEPQPQSTVLAK